MLFGLVSHSSAAGNAGLTSFLAGLKNSGSPKLSKGQSLNTVASAVSSIMAEVTEIKPIDCPPALLKKSHSGSKVEQVKQLQDLIGQYQAQERMAIVNQTMYQDVIKASIASRSTSSTALISRPVVKTCVTATQTERIMRPDECVVCATPLGGKKERAWCFPCNCVNYCMNCAYNMTARLKSLYEQFRLRATDATKTLDAADVLSVPTEARGKFFTEEDCLLALVALERNPHQVDYARWKAAKIEVEKLCNDRMHRNVSTSKHQAKPASAKKKAANPTKPTPKVTKAAPKQTPPPQKSPGFRKGLQTSILKGYRGGLAEYFREKRQSRKQGATRPSLGAIILRCVQAEMDAYLAKHTADGLPLPSSSTSASHVPPSEETTSGFPEAASPTSLTLLSRMVENSPEAGNSNPNTPRFETLCVGMILDLRTHRV